MPLYEYEDARTGGTVELVKLVSERDRVPSYLRRIEVPARIGVIQGLAKPEAAAAAVPRALRQIEQSMGHREMARQTGFSTEQMKRIWSIK